MTREEIDTLWLQAMAQAIKDGELFTRYEFAKLVAKVEREACLKIADQFADADMHSAMAANAIRARNTND